MSRAEPLTAEAPEAIVEQTPEEYDRRTIERMRAAVHGGTPWHIAVLGAIAEWRRPFEMLPDGRRYDYLLGGEAFDWVLLADRLIEEIEGRVPADEREALIFRGALPEEMSDDDFRHLIGPGKYRAHLNFIYGVRIEEALQLAVEEEVHKEHHSSPFAAESRAQEAMYQRVYGKGRAELYELYLEETQAQDCGSEMSLAELRDFIYWMFKFRVRRGEPARVASDTRKGIVQLSKLETIRRTTPLFSDPNEDAVFIDASVR